MNYKDSYLWKCSIANSNYGEENLRNELESIFDTSRKNAKYILDKIRADFSELTIHDITHADALWQVASVIVGEGYEMTPLEGFVLGCTFLMHDAVLSYYAAGGVDKLRDTIEWKDNYEDYKYDSSISDVQKIHETDFKTIRFLHAKYAKTIWNQLFEKKDGSKFYIIEDEMIRKHLGEIIGEIASSHHMNIDEVETLGAQLPVPSKYPKDWRINPIKLACILRCADAGHIDDGRAPDYLYALLDIHGLSKEHWVAQNHLSQIDIDTFDRNRVKICSNISFKEEEFAAWNVAYEAIQVLNHELHDSNELLKKYSCPLFQAKEVCGSKSRESLSKYIQTDGWKPFDAQIHISNVEGLIRNLGGEKLYGKDHKLEIALRELIQNARDAIVARRKLENEFVGAVHIKVYEEGGENWINVSDDGVGMSMNTIKNYFLNFGSSFWSSDLAKKEFGGLNSSGFRSVGKFGIGFYSIFMVATKVIVKTRKYDRALEDTIKIKFPNGLVLNPIITNENGKSKTSTEICFCVNQSEWKKEYVINPSALKEESFSIPLFAVLQHLVAGLDVDVFYSEYDQEEVCIHKDINNIKEGSRDLVEWLKDITFARYRGNDSFSQYIESNYLRVRKIVNNDKMVGMAALSNYWTNDATYFGVTTVGGLATPLYPGDTGDVLGCLIYEPITAKRDVDFNTIDKSEWAREQFEILLRQGLSNLDRLLLPYIVGRYGIDMTEEMVVAVRNKKNEVFYYRIDELLAFLNNNGRKLVFPISQISNSKMVDGYTDYYQTILKIGEDELVFVGLRNGGFLCLQEEEESYQYNIMKCLNLVATKMKLKITSKREHDKAVSRITGDCDACVVVVEKQNGLET